MQSSKVGADASFLFFSWNFFLCSGTGKGNYVTSLSANQISKKGIVSELQENALKWCQHSPSHDLELTTSIRLIYSYIKTATGLQQQNSTFGAGLNNVLALEQCVIKSPPHMQHWRIVQVRKAKAERSPNLVPVPIEQPFRRTPPWGWPLEALGT